MPNSSTGRPRDASTIRAALVAISVEKLSWLSSGVSSSWAAAERALDDGDRRVRVDDPALRDGLDAQAAEVDAAEPVAEGVVEQPAAGA